MVHILIGNLHQFSLGIALERIYRATDIESDGAAKAVDVKRSGQAFADCGSAVTSPAATGACRAADRGVKMI